MQFEPGSSADQLIELKEILQCVYVPLETKRQELKGSMQKFVGNLGQCLQQSYGNVTIETPDLKDEPPEILAKNSKLVTYLEGVIENWGQTIKETVNREEKRTRDTSTAMGKIEFWRNRSATFSTLYQQISHPKVKKIIEVMEHALRLNPDAYSIENYKQHVNEFNKNHAIAKDYVKFLNTLDRQFKNIGSGDLTLIEETLTSLMNGLKLVWTISRHINQDGDEMEDLMQAISNEISDKVASQIDNKKVFQMKADDALVLIDKGIKCLAKVLDAYNQTRIEIEREGYASRWDFNQNKLFGHTRYMGKILVNLRDACQAQHEFRVQLGHLKAVTGSSDDIEGITEQVNTAVGQIREFNQDLYNDSYNDPWQSNFSNFNSAVADIRKRIILLIDKTFKSELRSAEGGFDMLEKFKDTAFLHQDFKTAMEKNRTSILSIYEEELKQIRTLFEQGRNSPPISKNKPPVAGAISWARSLMHRIKVPIIKFKAHDRMLSKPEGQQVTMKYIKLAKELDKYETDLFDSWKAKNVETALGMLKRPILLKVGENKYQVNFTNELRMMIRESKYLDKMGFELSKTMLNIALQEKKYLFHIDNIAKMLTDYDEAVGNLKEVEKKLLRSRIQKLNKYLEPGTKPINWNSLSIEEFIQNCSTEIGHFRDTYGRVTKSAQMIEDIVQSVQNAILIREYDWQNYVKEKKPKRKTNQDDPEESDDEKLPEPKELMEFIDYFDQHRQEVLKELVAQYKRIGEQFLKDIEATTVGSDSLCAESMKEYYYYWERRIFNALTTMIVRALATIKVLFYRREKRPPLFRIQAEYNQPDLNFIPSKDEVMSQLEKFSKNVLEAAKQFGRWKDGHCQLCKERTNPETGEKYYNFTFFEDINKVKIVTELRYDIEHIRNQIGQKIGYVDSYWNKHYSRLKLFDTNEKTRLEKIIDKNPSTYVIEARILDMVKIRENINEHPHETQNIFMTIDTSEVIRKGKEQIEEWLALLKKGLNNVAMRELNAIQRKIGDYRKDLIQDPSTIESLKFLLRIITEIKDENMNMEFSIAEVKEKFSILKTHFTVEEATLAIVDSLEKEWTDLLFQAKKKDFELHQFKKSFADVTMRQVEQFQKEIEEAYQVYRATGPNSEVPLKEGFEALKMSKVQISEFNKQREEFVLAEKLFNLPISTYPLLIKMEENNKLLDQIYSVYDEHTTQVNEWSTLSWNKLDINALLKGASDFEVRVRRLAKEFEAYLPFIKLRKVIEGFKESVPLIEKLKNPAIQDRHWKRIIEETGRQDDINLKTITLGQVFKLELQNYQQAVDAIVVEAIQEASNEAKIVKIEQEWKIAQFEVVKYKKGNEERGWVLRAADDIKGMLEDDILTLQNIGGSPYAKAFIGRVRNWEKSLNLISDVIDIWFVVQRKWMYLESIFASDDIRQQLPEGAKKFDKVDKNFKRIMEASARNSNCYAACHAENRLSDLHNISKELDKCQKSLSNYLESKRFAFPRFYFISDDQLLFILGNSDPTAIQTHMLKLFDNCKELTFQRRIIVGMQSDEGEKYEYRTPVKPEGAVQDWMNKVEDEMKRTIHQITKEAVFHYAKSERIKWISQQIGMVAIVGTQIWWTFAVEDVFRRVKAGDKHAMKEESARQTKDLNDIVTRVRSDISNLERKKINSLIILDVHARDIVDRFVRDSILDAREFEWESQLRFYWERKEDDIRARQCTGIFTYGYEYQGLNGRLVITPLTDRCVMTLTTALTFKLGGSPAGPAGTGKTETVKDLAKSLTIRCVVNNCGEGLDYKAMGIIFSGLSQCGFWGCFDEFNRINPEVLSVVSTQIKTIQNSLITGKPTVKLLEMDMRLIPTIGIFVTMNPGYAGRSELPENVKALFRPVTMVVPNLVMICEIMLMSEGFTTARVLAKKMTVLYKLAFEQLSKQYHYDFGLRALKSVLVMAGSLKRGYPELGEDAVLMRALRDMNMPKFVYDDVPLFQGLINDLFPGLRPKRVGYQDLKDHIILELDSKGYKHSNDVLFENQVNKIIQLYETMLTRHTTMVVGPTGAGKSVVIYTLKQALKAHTGIPTKIEILNPKAQTVPELYGVLDPVTRDWTDGLLSKLFREMNEDLPPDKPERRWILYDGDVDALWVENMNSVMDDSKILTLTNGERIRLQKNCAMLYEVFDLQYASPATISRCGMVYVDPKNLGYAPFFERWAKIKTKTHSEVMTESLMDLYRRFIPQCIEYVLEGVTGEDAPGPPLEFITPRTNLNMVTQFCTLFDSILPEENPPQEVDQIENLFIFCIVWSIGGALQMEERPKFDEFIRKIAGRILPNTSLFDNYFDPKTMNLFPWENVVETYAPPSDRKFSSILVPTVDTKRYSWLLEQVMKLKKPCMFVGYSGTAKSVTAFSYLKKLDSDKYIKLNINFSSRTTSMDFQKTLEENVDKRSAKIYGPPAGRQLVVFVDDLNMPKIDTYGTQQPIALLRFLIQKNYLFQRGGDLERHEIVDTQYLGAMTPPGGGTPPVDSRFMTLFATFNITFPGRDSVEKIYNSILVNYLENFSQQMKEVVSKVTQATLKLYNTICQKLPRTPVKFHYIFNLRDLSRVYEGLALATVDKFETRESFLRLWRNECLRVFGDRLSDLQDCEYVGGELIPAIVSEFFPEQRQGIMTDPLLFGDFMLSDPSDPEAEDPRLYEDMNNFEQVATKLNKMLEEYNYVHKEMDIVLFQDALDHLTRIHRIIRFPRGNGLLIGVGGSGKQSLTRLATFTAGFNVFQMSIIKNYKQPDFREDLKQLYKSLLDGPQVFLFTDAHVLEEGFLELINNMLTIGMVPALFPEDEKDALFAGGIRDQFRKTGGIETKENLWQYFVNKARDSLHIVLAMSPAGDTLRIRCRNFPGLVSSTSIDWFFTWPREALEAVATHFLQYEQFDEEEHRGPVTDHIVMVHSSVGEYSKKFEEQLKRKTFVTPKFYLDFIRSYRKLLGTKRTRSDQLVRRLEGGLMTLIKAAEDTKVLSEELAEKNVEINEKKAIVEELIRDIHEKTEIAAEQQATAAEKKAFLDVESVKIQKEKAEADKMLEQAIPALQAAAEALKNLEKSDITEIRQFKEPPFWVKVVCQLTFYLKPTGREAGSDEWGNVLKTTMADPDLLNKLINYKKENLRDGQVKKARSLIAELTKKAGGDEQLKNSIKLANKASNGLYTWVIAILNWYDINKTVEPKRKKAQEMEKKLKKAEEELAATEANLKELSEKLADLNERREKSETELGQLTRISAKLAKRLNAATKLITGLASEQKRWSEDMEQFKLDKFRTVGDCLLGSAFLSYAGPFNHGFRKIMLYDDWQKDIKERGLPHNEGLSVQKLLTDEVEISKWASEGLPGDELSVQNGILTTRSNRWPLCIDPQMQAVNWIKQKERNNKLEVTNFNLHDYMKKLEMSIQFGHPVLFEAIDEEIDPMLDPVLEKNYVVKAGQKFIKVTDNQIEWDDNFKLYFTSKLANPKYTPEIMGKTMIINYNVTLDGLKDQLLNEVVGYERPELERQRKQLIIETSENKAKLKQEEDLLLSELSNNTGPLVDNEPLIETLEGAKEKAEKIASDLKIAEATAADIEISRSNYVTVAKRGAILFFAMAGLSSISEMYEYSLTAYLEVFRKALATSRKDNILQNRLRNIKEKLTQNVFDFTCMGIFERHKITFSLQMTLMIMDGEGELNHIELEFFLKGNTSLEEIARKKPYRWLSDKGWKDAQKLVTLNETWGSFIQDLISAEDPWRRWYDLERPEDSELPMGYEKKLNSFQKMLLVRIFRSDRVFNATKLFILNYLSEHYVQSHPIPYDQIFAQSNERSPIVFILSPGADPLANVQKLAESVFGAGSNKFRFLALGQGMENDAKALIDGGILKGHWVMLQNCHLLTSWLKKLESIIEGLHKPDKHFRLWLTTEPTNMFPLGILQKSLKVVTEPPDGLRQNIRGSFARVNDQMLESCDHQAFRPLIYVLAFFHAVVQERRKFGKIGWNVTYDFNEADFSISFELLSMYLTKALVNGDQVLPWGSLNYLIGEAMYGGRVTDDFDRRVLVTYLSEYMGEFIFDKNQPFFFSKGEFNYKIIAGANSNIEQILKYIEDMPRNATPEVFGLHSNAEIQYLTNNAKAMWVSLIEMQTSSSSSAGAVDRDTYIKSVADGIQARLPQVFDEFNIRKMFDTPKPTQIVLLQELERFDILLLKLHDSLFNLQRALKGQIGMSQELDELSNSLFNGFLPEMWRKLAPQTEKLLANWMSHFERRHAQYKDWVEIEEPKVMWLSGLHIPESYLTALVQTTCRAKKWALDKSTLYTIVTKMRSAEEVTERLEHGNYIQGLYLEGAKWNFEDSCLALQDPKELVVEMPLIQIVPVEVNKLKLRGMLKTPVYVTQHRKNAMGKGLVFEADLRSNEHISHWILQGVCLVLNTD